MQTESGSVNLNQSGDMDIINAPVAMDVIESAE